MKKWKRMPARAGLAGIATLLAICAALAIAKSGDDYVARGKRAWEDVKVLADDAMEGRRAGTPGHRRAAEFVAKQFRAAGLVPAGDDGFLQRVNLESRTIREDRSRLALVMPAGEEQLTPGDDALFSLRGNFAAAVDAPLVFAGHGMRLPQFGHDDLTGLDLKGKVVVYISSAPSTVPGAAGAHFSSGVERWKVYHAAGAVGMIAIPNPFSNDLPWERYADLRLDPQLALAAPEEDQFPGQQIWLLYNPAKIARLLAGTAETEESLLAKIKAGGQLPRFDLKMRIRATIAADVANVTSENVVGVLPGKDRELSSELVVLSAHLDHLGIGSQGSGDRLFNGAMDNATGVATLIDVARELARSHQRPRRSIVFAAVTAEEAGLLGSRAYVSRAKREGLKIVADLNSDMYLPLFPLDQLIVFGLDESVLGNDARAVGTELKVRVTPDPEPQRNRFIRSDQYSFIRAGIPSLALKTGFEPGSAEAQIERKWFAERYHAPSDDLAQPVDFGAAGKFSELTERLALRIANRKDAPVWRESSVFATLPGGAPAAASQERASQ